MPDFAVTTAFRATDRISPAFSKMSASADRFAAHSSGAFNKANSGASGFMSSFKGNMLGALGVGSVIALANKSIDLYKESQEAVANVESAIRATGNAAGISSKQFQGMAKALMKNSIFEDDSILQNVTTQLLTFNNIKGEDVFSKAQTTVADIASRLKGTKATSEDLMGLSIMLGKVLQDPANKMDALARRGIIFSEAEKSTIKSLTAQGKMREAQLYMLDAISKAGYGGAAKDIAATSAGKALQRQNEIGDAMKNVGEKLLPLKVTMMALVVALMPAFEAIADLLGEISPYLEPVVGYLKEGLKAIKPLIKPIVYGFIAWGIAILALKMGTFISNVGSAVSSMWELRRCLPKAIMMTDSFRKAQAFLNGTLLANPIGLIIVGIIALGVLTALIIKNWNKWGAAATLLLGPFGQLIAIFKTVYDNWDRVKKAFETEGILGGLKQIGLTIISGLLYPIQQLLELLSNIPFLEDKLKNATDALRRARGEKVEKTAPSKKTGGSSYSPLTAPNAALRSAAIEGIFGSYQANINFSNIPKGVSIDETRQGAQLIDTTKLGPNY